MGVAALVLAACSSADSGQADANAEQIADGAAAIDTAGSGEGGDWTVLIYSMADTTNIEDGMMQDLDEAGSVGSADRLDVVALVDRAVGESDADVLDLGDFAGAKIVHLQPGGVTELMQDVGDVNTSDPEILSRFIAESVTRFPSDRYALIMSDHGASWPGIGQDLSAGGDTMNLAELQLGLEEGLAAAGLERFDLLGFDACLMATYEVATAVAPYASRLVASEELEPGHGWDYAVLEQLAADPTMDADQLGTAIVDGYRAQAEQHPESKDSITLSLLDLEQVDLLDVAVADLAGALAARAAPLGGLIGAQRARTLEFGRDPNDPAQSMQSVDLGLLASNIGVEALDLSDQADAVVRAVNDVVVHQVQGAAMLRASGLAVYFPSREELFQPDYREVFPTSTWLAFLDAFYGAGEAIPADAVPQATDAEAEVTEAEGGLTISATFDVPAENASVAWIEYGSTDEDGTTTYFGTEPAVIADDGSGVVTATSDRTMLQISDGEDTAFAYADISFDDAGTMTIDVPMIYDAGDGAEPADVTLSIVLDTDSGEITQEAYFLYEADAGTYSELDVADGGIVVPVVLEVLADGTSSWVPSVDVALWADISSLQYEFVPFEAGAAITLALSLEDFGGNIATVYASVES